MTRALQPLLKVPSGDLGVVVLRGRRAQQSEGRCGPQREHGDLPLRHCWVQQPFLIVFCECLPAVIHKEDMV